MIRGFALRVALAGVFTIGLIHGDASLAQTEQDSVIAIVNGKTILTSDMTMFQNSLPEEYRRVNINLLFPQLLEGLIDSRLLAQAALEAGMMDDPLVKRRLAYVTNDVLQQAYLDQLLAEEITEERMRETYEATIPTQPGEEEISARHILLEDEGAAEDPAVLEVQRTYLRRPRAEQHVVDPFRIEAAGFPGGGGHSMVNVGFRR